MGTIFLGGSFYRYLEFKRLGQVPASLKIQPNCSSYKTGYLKRFSRSVAKVIGGRQILYHYLFYVLAGVFCILVIKIPE